VLWAQVAAPTRPPAHSPRGRHARPLQQSASVLQEAPCSLRPDKVVFRAAGFGVQPASRAHCGSQQLGSTRAQPGMGQCMQHRAAPATPCTVGPGQCRHTCTPAHLHTCTPAHLHTCTHTHIHACPACVQQVPTWVWGAAVGKELRRIRPQTFGVVEEQHPVLSPAGSCKREACVRHLHAPIPPTAPSSTPATASRQ